MTTHSFALAYKLEKEEISILDDYLDEFGTKLGLVKLKKFYDTNINEWKRGLNTADYEKLKTAIKKIRKIIKIQLGEESEAEEDAEKIRKVLPFVPKDLRKLLNELIEKWEKIENLLEQQLDKLPDYEKVDKNTAEKEQEFKRLVIEESLTVKCIKEKILPELNQLIRH
ncbi:hypothetical protein ACFL0W_05770 [Nanoarchaeota archaeon]